MSDIGINNWYQYLRLTRVRFPDRVKKNINKNQGCGEMEKREIINALSDIAVLLEVSKDPKMDETSRIPMIKISLQQVEQLIERLDP